MGCAQSKKKEEEELDFPEGASELQGRTISQVIQSWLARRSGCLELAYLLSHRDPEVPRLKDLCLFKLAAADGFRQPLDDIVRPLRIENFWQCKIPRLSSYCTHFYLRLEVKIFQLNHRPKTKISRELIWKLPNEDNPYGGSLPLLFHESTDNRDVMFAFQYDFYASSPVPISLAVLQLLCEHIVTKGVFKEEVVRQLKYRGNAKLSYGLFNGMTGSAVYLRSREKAPSCKWSDMTLLPATRLVIISSKSKKNDNMDYVDLIDDIDNKKPFSMRLFEFLAPYVVEQREMMSTYVMEQCRINRNE